MAGPPLHKTTAWQGSEDGMEILKLKRAFGEAPTAACEGARAPRHEETSPRMPSLYDDGAESLDCHL